MNRLPSPCPPWPERRAGGVRYLLPCAVLFLGVTLPAQDHDPSRLLVRIRPTVTPVEVQTMESAHGLRLIREIPLVKVRVYALPPDRTAGELQPLLRRDQRIDLVELDHLRTGSSANDPLYPFQWSLHNSGQQVNGTSGPADLDINWPEALARTPASNPVLVAVVDSGVALTHGDLLGQIHVNQAELNGRTGIDDDGNGYIDDYSGYDFYAGDVLPYDENGHGTLVASLIAGIRNNGVGITGVAPMARILPVRVLGQLGQGGVPRYSRISDVVSALAYAGLAGARVINLSLGGSGYNPVELEMLGILHQLGILVVAAAGNGGGDGVGDNLDQAPFYPASYGTPNLIVVAAQDRSGGLAPFSNFGAQSVHLAAPGTDLVGADISRRTLFRETFEAPSNGWLAGSNFGNFSLDSWQFAGPTGGRYLTDHDPSLSGYLPYANLWARSPLLDLRGIVGTRLEFDSVLSLADDLLVVEASADGALWWNFATLGGLNNGYARQSIDLSDLDGLFGYFRFRLISNGAWQGLGVGIDNIEVSALAPFDASTPTFRFNSGTSFAAPLVSGVAALILSRRPDVSVAQLRACLLDSVRPVSTLAGKVVTGGMLDANEALRRADLLPLPPVITQGPVGRTVALGDPLTLSVVATGTPPFSFQWRKDGAALPGATSSTLTLATTQAGDAGVYAVVVTNAAGGVVSLGATIVIGPAPTTHSADVNRDFRLGLLELTRVIELYNTRNAGLRTGCYAVSGAGSEDGFAPEPARANAPVATLARYHSADVNRDGRMGLLELTRVIELYNYRSAGTRTGQYRILAGSEDGFAAGA